MVAVRAYTVGCFFEQVPKSSGSLSYANQYEFGNVQCTLFNQMHVNPKSIKYILKGVRMACSARGFSMGGSDTPPPGVQFCQTSSILL